MKIFSASFTDLIKFDKKPNEDFYLISKIFPIFVLADGITQAHFPSGEYAFPLGARAAAEIFCFTVLEFLEKRLSSKIHDREKLITKLIKKGFDLANKRIWELNKAEGITEKLDYFVYDYFDTVGILGIILKDNIYYGYVGDCSLLIFDKKNNLRFWTRDQVGPVLKRKAPKKIPDWNNLSEPEKIKILHKEFRNHPSGRGYGSFTGEKEVKKYYEIGNFSLNSGDMIVFYSDGFLPYFKFPEFIKILRKQDKKALEDFTLKKAKENHKKFGTDRTVIAINY